MRGVLGSGKVSVERNILMFKKDALGNDTKIPVEKTDFIYVEISGRVVEEKLFVAGRTFNGGKVAIQQGDIVTDHLTSVKYLVTGFPTPLLICGRVHHWEASIERYINQ
jgi:hypothetical protein